MSNTSLINMVKERNMEEIRRLLQAGVDVNESGVEQGWTALNYAAGSGNLDIVRLLVECGADVFKTGRDNRTPYKIALAASHVETAKYLAGIEAASGGDRERISSREGEDRPYCKAYLLDRLRKYPHWKEGGRPEAKDGEEDIRSGLEGVVFIHQDYTVTWSIWHNEDVLFGDITEEWKEFCERELKFAVPSDFDLVPGNDSRG